MVKGAEPWFCAEQKSKNLGFFANGPWRLKTAGYKSGKSLGLLIDGNVKMKGKFPTYLAKEASHASVQCFCLNLQVLLVILHIFLHSVLVFRFVLFLTSKEVCFVSPRAVWIPVTQFSSFTRAVNVFELLSL